MGEAESTGPTKNGRTLTVEAPEAGADPGYGFPGPDINMTKKSSK